MFEATLSAGTAIDRYTVLRRIGEGGMGVVYAAFDPALDRKVAIKLLRRQADSDAHGTQLQSQLITEARAMAQLAHPNVVAVFEIGRFSGQMFLVMELVEGQTLRDWLAEKPRGWRKIVEVFVAAGQGLAAAHAAGLVHRDFKPANVLVGRDGRARVTDFGLVQDRMLPNPGGALDGTLHYMAPEQFRGEPADERTDQFSFCVALFTALYGVRPFRGDSVAALAANVCQGRRYEPRTARRVPRRIRAALRRGLSVEPSARFATLPALLAALTPSAHRGSWAILLGAALVVLGWLATRSPAEIPDQRCTGAAAAFATAWNPERRHAIEAAFTATRAPYAADALAKLIGALDRYAVQWTQAHTAACRATRVEGEQTEATLDLRMMCLERRRQDAAALVTALGGATADVVARSVSAVEGLGDVGPCADIATLRQVVALPHGEVGRKLAALAPRLAEVQAMYDTGVYLRARERIRPLVAEARALAYRPFEAEAEFLQGQIETALGDMTAAETSLESAVWSAEAGRHDRVAAQGWTRLLYVVGYHRAEYARALALAPRATAAIARLGGDAGIEYGLERALGAIDVAQTKLDTAIVHLEHALALAERAYGRERFEVAIALLALGGAIGTQGHLDQALPLLERARELQERLLGPDHPRTAEALTILAIVHNLAGTPQLAEQELRRALAIREAALGPQHRDVAFTLSSLGDSLDAQGRSDEAVAGDRRAVAIAEQAFGPEHPATAELRITLGIHLGHLARFAEAEDQLRRGEEIYTKVGSADHLGAILAGAARGDLLLRQAQWRHALALYDRAIAVLERDHIPRKELSWAIVHREIAAVELHQPARGLPALEELAGKLDLLSPDLRIAAQWTLSRALCASGGDRVRARELARRARAESDRVGARGDEVTWIRRWASQHSCDRRAPHQP